MDLAFIFNHSVMDDIKTLNKISGIKSELDRLSLQKYALNQACSRQSQSLIALAKLKAIVQLKTE
jgi:hypothetical protein